MSFEVKDANCGFVKCLREVHLDDAFRVVTKAIEAMRKNGIDQWDEYYPDRQMIANDFFAGSLYGYFEGEQLKGIVVLNEIQDASYRQIEWEDKNGQVLVIHRLTVHPDFQGRGIARQLVIHAEEFAKQAGYSSIRLDAFVFNPKANRLYSRFGYQLRGEVHLRKGVFMVYEKLIVPSLFSTQ